MRRERREAFLMVVIALAFAAVSVVLILFAGNPWVGAVGIAFSVGVLAAAIAKSNRSHEPAARIGALIGSMAFGATGAAMIASSFITPSPFGERQLPVLISGVLFLVLFGGGSVLLLLHQIRRSRAPRKRTRL